MIDNNRENCCGCEACAAVCGHNAIRFDRDTLGFLLPKVNLDACIGCGMCDKVCPFNVKESDYATPRTYAARNRDIDVVRASRSGGVFSSIADSIIEKGGVVYGAALNSNLSVEHTRIEDKEDLNKLRGSKYAQSAMAGIYKDILNDLKSGRTVLFSGVPCQVAAVRKYIPRIFHDKLFLVDLICHGVASPAVWMSFVEYVSARSRKKIVGANFRDKEKYGWDGLHKESFKREDGCNVYVPYVYYNDAHMRHSCNNCPFSTLQRVSDITLGDLWSWEKVAPDLNEDGLGCSLLICNTFKGAELLELLTKDIVIKPVSLDLVLQPNLKTPSSRNIERENYEKDYCRLPFTEVLEKYHKPYRPGLLKILKNKIRMILKNK